MLHKPFGFSRAFKNLQGGLFLKTNLFERSLVIQLLPKQIQLLLLDRLLTAHHVHNHAVIHTSVWIPILSRDRTVIKMQKTSLGRGQEWSH